MLRRLIPVVASVMASALTVDHTTLERFDFAEPHMGTMVRIVLYAPEEGRAGRAARAAFDRIAALDGVLSDYRSDSELSRLSARAGSGPVPAGDDLLRVLDDAQRLARETDGAFDVTVGPLSVLWRDRRETRERPEPRALQEARARVGYRHVDVDPDARTVALAVPGMRLDLGGIGKGFAADEALKVLVTHGITRALIAASGDLVAGDPPPGLAGWRVEMDLPGERGDSPDSPHSPLDSQENGGCPHFLLRNAAVSTSGDAEQFVVIDEVRYSHIVDPRTGVGLTPSRQATVIAPTGTASDSLATAVAVLGADQGLALADRQPSTAALVATRSGDALDVRASTRWRAMACPRYPSEEAPPLAASHGDSPM